ncbi:hypothetical protein [Nitrosomonas sp. Nm166]|uniref:hypothetical protein n=1 Tax=Nitrosomonas sp. Nm166 TaxID=1881054 RepID=UPI0008E988E4|nr:hypothetical protein [Nitrosomonas sp. Nm166]SFE83642.1 hypothetical protein SAMN05428977_10322 [Nitrosomonas sp. Nm166]
MGFDPDACRRVIASGSSARPEGKKNAGNSWKCFNQERYYWLWKIPRPDPPELIFDFNIAQFGLNKALFSDTDPQSNLNILSELLIDRLRSGPTSTPSIFNEVIRSCIEMKVVGELAEQFEESAKFLRAELEILEKSYKECK